MEDENTVIAHLGPIAAEKSERHGQGQPRGMSCVKTAEHASLVASAYTLLAFLGRSHKHFVYLPCA